MCYERDQVSTVCRMQFVAIIILIPRCRAMYEEYWCLLKIPSHCHFGLLDDKARSSLHSVWDLFRCVWGYLSLLEIRLF